MGRNDRKIVRPMVGASNAEAEFLFIIGNLRGVGGLNAHNKDLRRLI